LNGQQFDGLFEAKVLLEDWQSRLLRKAFAYDEDPSWVEHIFLVKSKKPWKNSLAG
jgi:hypothetical protein